MSLIGVVSLVGVVFGIELTLRVIDYLYTNKVHRVGTHKKDKKHNKTHKENRKTSQTY